MNSKKGKLDFFIQWPLSGNALRDPLRRKSIISQLWPVAA
jgi:hypothetical protein